MRLIYAIPIILLPNTAHLPADVSVSISVVLVLLAMGLGDGDRACLAGRGGGFGGWVGLVGGVVDPVVSPPLVDDTIRLLN